MPDEDSPQLAAEGEVSLEQLSETFARLFAADLPQNAAAESGIPPLAVSQDPATAVTDRDDDTGEVTPLRLLEAMLFVGSPSNEPLSAERSASVMRGVAAEEIHDLIRQLNDEYAANRCPYQIVSEGSGYRLTLTAEHQRLRDKFQGRQRQARLSQAAVEVLALVAYHEPLTAEQVNRLRNIPSGAVLTQLVRRQLLRLERNEAEPRVVRYRTTQRFLDLFGLESVADLPQSQDLG
jgi:segregation and condensation protein B